jgi:hypothetical protein
MSSLLMEGGGGRREEKGEKEGRVKKKELEKAPLLIQQRTGVALRVV